MLTPLKSTIPNQFHTAPTHHRRLSDVLREVELTGNKYALDAFAKAEQDTRLDTAAREWISYRITDDRKGIINPQGQVYNFAHEADWTMVFPTVPDQAYCNKINYHLRRLNLTRRMYTKHDEIRRRLLEAGL